MYNLFLSNLFCVQYVKNGETISYLWEIDLLSTSTNTLETLAESLKFNFLIKYASVEKPESPQDLNFEFTLNNYKVKLKIMI